MTSAREVIANVQRVRLPIFVVIAPPWLVSDYLQDGQKERGLPSAATPVEQALGPTFLRSAELHRGDDVQEHALGEEGADPIRGRSRDPLRVLGEPPEAAFHDLAYFRVVAGRIRLHLRLQAPGILDDLVGIRPTDRQQRFLAFQTCGGRLEHLQRLGQATLYCGDEELLLRPEEAEEVRLRDAGASRDLVGRRSVQSALREEVLCGPEDRLPALLRGLSLGCRRRHGSRKLALTYLLVKWVRAIESLASPAVKPLTILVSAAGAPGTAALLRALRSNGEREVRLVGTDMSERAIGRHLCDAFHRVPPGTDGGFADAMLDVCRSERVVAACGIEHFFNIQLVGDRVIEINPRISTIVYQEDLNLPYLGVKHALGEISADELGAFAARVRSTRRALRYFDQVEWDE